MNVSANHACDTIRCPMRNQVISSEVCHTCSNHIRVLFRSETPPELQCTRWSWSPSLPLRDVLEGL